MKLRIHIHLLPRISGALICSPFMASWRGEWEVVNIRDREKDINVIITLCTERFEF